MLPEKRLLAAVLQRAITDFLSNDQDVQADSAEWLLGSDVVDSPLTFSFVCEALDIDPDGLRRQIISQRTAIDEGNSSDLSQLAFANAAVV
jgi:hypothetical protein